jgi:hypothetical protein
VGAALDMRSMAYRSKMCAASAEAAAATKPSKRLMQDPQRDLHKGHPSASFLCMEHDRTECIRAGEHECMKCPGQLLSKRPCVTR